MRYTNTLNYLLTYCVRLATTLLKDEEIARESNVLACNFVAKYSPILIFSFQSYKQELAVLDPRVGHTM